MNVDSKKLEHVVLMAESLRLLRGTKLEALAETALNHALADLGHKAALKLPHNKEEAERLVRDFLLEHTPASA